MSRKLDALFAEKVLGIRYVRGKMSRGDDYYERGNGDKLVLPYTHSLDAAWAGVPKLHRKGFELKITTTRYAEFDELAFNVEIWEQEERKAAVFGADPDCPLPETIVRAILFAFGVTQQEIDDAEEKETSTQAEKTA